MASWGWWWKSALAALLAMAALGAAGGASAAPGDPVFAKLQQYVAEGRLDQEVYDALASNGRAEAFIVLQPGVAPPAVPSLYPAAKAKALKSAGDGGASLVRDYDRLPTQFVRMHSPSAVAKLLSDGTSVAAIRANHARTTDLAQSTVLINQPQAVAAGYTGSGYSVAVLDTGLDYTRTAFGVCPNPLPSPAPAGCRVAYVQDFAPQDNQLDANGHGTNVAGIVAGVAPGARVLGLDVFNGQYAYDSDIIAAINWTIANRVTYNITAVNLSLGDSSRWTASCTGTSYEAAFANLRANGILPVVAAGNGAYAGGTFGNGISSPGCVPGALSVGAVYDANIGGVGYSTCSDSTTAADRVTCFSQTGPVLSMLAPGAAITAAGSTMYGTSQATPHVAGAVAVLAQANPGSSAAGRESALTGSGPAITDTRPSPSVTKRRLDLCAAVAAVGGACPAGVATKLGFAAQPSGGTSGAAFATQPAVAVQDAAGNTVAGATDTVTLSLVGSGGTLSCTGGLSKAAVNGVASFSGCAVTGSGTFSLRATASGLAQADSSSFGVSAVPAKLGFAAQPSGGAPGVPLPIQPAVLVEDAAGSVVPGATNSVTLALAAGPGTLSCAGGLTKAAVNGVALFAGCTVSSAGAGYVIRATASGLAAADTPGFDVASAGGPPAAPAFAAPIVTSTTAQVTWTDNADNETGYRVLKYTPGGWVQAGPDLAAGTTSWTDPSLTPASYYAYWVQAFNASGTSATPSYLTVITVGLPVAPKPESASGISATQTRITWSDNATNEAGFKVLRYQGGSWVEVGNTGANSTTFTDGGLAAGQTYAYWVVAYNSAGWSYAPAYIAASTFASAPGTGVPNYDGASVTATTATVRWTDTGSGPSQEDGFRVLRSGPGGWTQVGPDLPPDSTEFTDSGLTPGTYYAYWVVSFRGAAQTYAKSYITAITSDLVPNAPVFTSATADGPSSATLTWLDTSSGESGFKVLRYMGGVWSVVGTVGPDVTTFTDTGLAGKTTYAYWITSYSATGSAYGSALISVATP